MDIVNLWKETGNSWQDRINIIKTWLCNGTDGQTYSINENIFDINFELIDNKKWNVSSFSCEKQFDEILGFKHDYKIDDENLDRIAKDILDGLNKLIADIYDHSEKYFEARKDEKDKMFCHAIEGIHCVYAAFNELFKCDMCSYIDKCPFKSNAPVHPLTND